MGRELEGQLPLFGTEPLVRKESDPPLFKWRAYHPTRLWCDECLGDRARGYDGRLYKARWVLTTPDGQELLCSIHAEARRTAQQMAARTSRKEGQ
jgi:hypothetical protein